MYKVAVDSYQKKHHELMDCLVVDFLEYIDCHFLSDISLKKTADHFYLNYTYCSEIFKKVTGMGFSAYITKLRLCHACKLLDETSIQIAEISEKSGFHDYFYFSKQFKKELNVTPTEYRYMKNLTKRMGIYSEENYPTERQVSKMFQQVTLAQQNAQLLRLF